MGLSKKLFLALILTAAGAFISASIIGWNPNIKPITLDTIEKATIQNVSFDSAKNELLLDVQSMDSNTIVFNAAIIENSDHRIVATIVPFQAELPAYKNITITINLNDINLGFGNYTVNLRTAKTYNFYSPSFTIS